jgi:hypothetical protein
MDVASPGLFPVASVLWQPTPSAWALTVVSKATFSLAPVESPLAPDQDGIVEHDAHQDDADARSLRAASDLAPFKANADVVLVGHAFAPGAAPSRRVLARLVVGPIDKSIEVLCDRWLDPQGVLSEGPSFTRMPLVHERAAGGPDQRVPELRGDERIVLENLHPAHPRLVTHLPGVRLRAVLTGSAGGPLEIPMRADTLTIDADRGVCTLTFRGHVVLAHPEEKGRIVVVAEMPGKPLTVEDIARVPTVLRLASPEDLSAEDLENSTMPFAESAPPRLPLTRAADAAQGSTGARSAGPRAASRWSGLRPDTTLPLDTTKPFPDLPSMPFLSPPAPPAAIAPPPPAAIAPMIPPVPRQTIGDRLAAASRPAAAIAQPAPAPPPPPAPAPAPAPAARAEAARDVLLLVWLDRKSVPRIVRKPAWQRILDALEDEPLDPQGDDAVLSDVSAETEERAQVLAVLDRAAAIDRQGLYDALARAAGKRAGLSPPIELVEGDLALPFDDIATLEAMVSTVTPLAGGDEALSGALATATDFLRTSGVKAAPAVARALTARIREVLRQAGRAVPADEVDAQLERALLEERRYQKRRVLGGSHLRALLFMDAPERPPVICYLPEALAEDLPMAARFRARILAEVHLAVDEQEAQPVALRASALGRVVRLPVG